MLLPILFAALSSPALTTFVDATWSITATDRKSGHVGVAATTCRFNWNDSEFKDDYVLVPGTLVAASQASGYPCHAQNAASNYLQGVGTDLNRPQITPTQAILQLQNDATCLLGNYDQVSLVDMNDSDVWPDTSLTGNSDGYLTGTVKGDIVYSIQGNDLDSASGIFKAAKKKFAKAGKSKKKDIMGCDLAGRLMQGLLAGNEVGGDVDCDRVAQNIYYFKVMDKHGNTVLELYDDDVQSTDPVGVLYEKFKEERQGGDWCKKTKRYLPPLPPKSRGSSTIMISGTFAIVGLGFVLRKGRKGKNTQPPEIGRAHV